MQTSRFLFTQTLDRTSGPPCWAVFQFWALYFSLSIVLQIFTRVFSLVPEWAHRQGICLLMYLGNWLVIADSVPHVLEYQELLFNFF